MKKLFGLIIALIISGGTFAQESLELNNDTLHLKQDLTRGGAIYYISEAGSTRNLVNIHDEGRYVQQSYYAGKPLDRQADGQNPNWSPWAWNPIQVGDSYRNRAQILEQSNEDGTLYVKCIPMLWDMNNEPAEAEMEQWTTLMGKVIKVRNRITCKRTDDIWGEGQWRNQELPAVYPIASLNILYSYFGTFPWTGAALSRPEVINLGSGFWGRYLNDMVSENWMAFVDDKGWGMGVYTPISTNFLAGRAGQVAIGEANDGPTSYIAPVKQVQMFKNTVYEYEYYLVIGSIDQIRNEIYSLKGIQVTAWEFEDDLDGWNEELSGGAVSQETGSMVFSCEGTEPSISRTVYNWDTDMQNYLWINLKNETGSDSSALRFFTETGDSATIWIGTTANSDSFEDKVIRLDTMDSWSNADGIRKFRLIPAESGVSGTVSVDFIRFQEKLMILSSQGDQREIGGLGQTLQLYARQIPDLSDMDVDWSVDHPERAWVSTAGLVTALSGGLVEITATEIADTSQSSSMTLMIIDDTKKISWEFIDDEEGWDKNLHNAAVSQEDGALVFSITGDDPYVANNVDPWTVDNLKFLCLRIKNKTPNNLGALYLFPKDGGHDFVTYPLLPNDTVYRDVIVDMRRAGKWKKDLVLSTLRLDGSQGGGAGNIYFDFIRFRDEVIRISGPGDDLYIDEIGKSLQLEAQLIVDYNQDVDFEWSTDESGILSVDQNGLVTGLQEGTASVKVTDKYGSDISGEVQIVVVRGTSVESPGQDRPAIYPNPVGDILYLSHADNIQSVSIIDMSGKVVKEHPGNARILEIDTSKLKSGVYLLRAHSVHGKNTYARFVKE